MKQSSLQLRDYKFCRKCEKRFNVGGEAWVLKVVPDDYGAKFPIHDILAAAKKTPVREGLILFPAAKIPTIALDQLVHFGMSIFWRGTLDWSAVNGGILPKVFMNLRQEKAIRQFLLGQGTLPKDVVITVAVWPFKKVPPMSIVPVLDETTSYRRYWFYFSGFIFSLAFGKRIPADVKRTDAYRSRVLTLSAEIGEAARQVIVKNVMAADKSAIKGTLQEIAAMRSKISSSK
jgi:hypothetical protein